MVVFKSDNKTKEKKNKGVTKPTGVMKPSKPKPNKGLVKPVKQSPKLEVKNPKQMSRVARNKSRDLNDSIEVKKQITPIREENTKSVSITKPKIVDEDKSNRMLDTVVDTIAEVGETTDVVKDRIIGEVESVNPISTTTLTKSIEPKVKPISKLLNNTNVVSQSSIPVEGKLSRFNVRKEPLRMPKFLTGYPKISELRCKQLTTSDIISDNKYAYSEKYSDKKEYPIVEDFVLLNDENDLTVVTTESKPKSLEIKTDEIIPSLSFGIGGIEPSEMALTEMNSDTIEEIKLEEDMEEISLTDIDSELEDIELEEEEIKLEEEEIQLVEEEEIQLVEDEEILLIEEENELVEEDLLLIEEDAVEQIEDLQPLVVDEDILLEDEIEEPLELEDSIGDISLDDISDIEESSNLDFNSILMNDNNVVGEGLVTGTPFVLEDDFIEINETETEDDELTNNLEINTEETDINKGENEEDLVNLYGTEKTLEEEEEEPKLVKQSFGSKVSNSSLIGNLDMGLTYDINDIKINESSENINKTFLDDNEEDIDLLKGIDVSDLLSFGENDILLSRSKDIHEALKYIK